MNTIIIGHHARLKESEIRANLRALTTQKSCAVGMRNAILRNHLKEKGKLEKSRDTL